MFLAKCTGFLGVIYPSVFSKSSHHAPSDGFVVEVRCFPTDLFNSSRKPCFVEISIFCEDHTYGANVFDRDHDVVDVLFRDQGKLLRKQKSLKSLEKTQPRSQIPHKNIR